MVGLGLSHGPTRAAALSLTSVRVAKVVASFALLALYAFSQPLDARGHITDVSAATFPAWHFVSTGTFELSEHADSSDWFVTTERGVFSNRTPGVIATATLGYAIAQPLSSGYSTLPGNLVAIGSSWLAVIVVAAAAERLRRGLWFPALVLFGLGTSTWSISANQLWAHGPAQLGIAAAVYLLIDRKELGSGLAFAAAVLIRPPTIILALGTAVARALHERSWRPLRLIGGPALTAAALFLAYTRVVFGSWSPVASYEAVGGFYLTGAWERVANVLSALGSPRYGVLMWSFWIVLCLVFAYRKGSKTGPGWLAATPLIAGVYIIVHSLLEIASGAFPYNYRYPLEAVTLAAPFLLSVVPRLLKSPVARTALVVAGCFAVFLQASFLYLSECWLAIPESGMMACELFGKI